jgi:hypothetical protein
MNLLSRCLAASTLGFCAALCASPALAALTLCNRTS